MKRYNPKEIEPKWQQRWAESKIYEATESPDKPKRYVLEYFPYPSGAAMHVGHVRNYTIGDAVARHARMTGHNVLHPMGWDAFGLPAENYAIKNGISPQQAIAENTSKFKAQLTQMGFSYDWSREINSSDPRYYKWTQWFFKLLLERGLAYQKDSLQWWCETDKTVLANEQVEAGKCWRCGNTVVKKPLKQWFFKITDYADRLSDDLDNLDWSEAIKSMQRNWIGKSKGAEVEFVVGEHKKHADTLKFTPELTELVQSGKKWSTIRLDPKNLKVGDTSKLQTRYDATTVTSFALAEITEIETNTLADIPVDYDGHETYADKDEQLKNYQAYYGKEVTLETEFTIYTFKKLADIVTVFTTRPDTLYGATFMVLAPEHPLVATIVSEEQKDAVNAYVLAAQKKSDIERQENKEKTGVFTGAYAKNPVNGEDVPVWIADYVLTGYGTGAIMAVPAHDERDYEFATKFDLPIQAVIQSNAKESGFTHSEGIMINSGKYNEMPSADAREAIVADLEQSGAGKEVTNYKIRDWLISRQRYWGAPIPVIHCEKDGVVPVPDADLPLVLPEVESYLPTGEGTSVLASVSDWVNVSCPTCGGPAKRETDTMDGFACSSWYFLRFADPHNDSAPFTPERAKFWLPVDDYIGGAEHAVMHLLYARMWTKVMHDAGLIAFDEPFAS
ncbi:MAG: class I tRNA ligase family protein, partial [Candidatus Saccharimonadales bacterium]